MPVVALPPNSTFSIDRDAVFRTMQITQDSAMWDAMCDLYDEMRAQAEELIVPFAAYQVQPNTVDEAALAQYPEVAMALSTIGEPIGARVRALFAASEFPNAMMLDHIADAYIGAVDRVLCDAILADLAQRGWGASMRMSPGEQIPIAHQQTLVATLRAAQGAPVTVTESNMMAPVKTLSFMFGCGEGVQGDQICHDCSKCTFSHCLWRHQ